MLVRDMSLAKKLITICSSSTQVLGRHMDVACVSRDDVPECAPECS